MKFLLKTLSLSSKNFPNPRPAAGKASPTVRANADLCQSVELVFYGQRTTAALARHYVYVLRCADGSLYTGYTTDPGRRVRQHNKGTASKYTRGRGPVMLVHLEEAATRGMALKREVAIKSMARKEKLQLSTTGSRISRHSVR
ncbi:MAG: GIY-YIG nuclease family protein [Thaumarchaeota archaeon]|nr:GIY-YIG nuclease family protein [Nitrososphaerota archaeon]